MQTDDAGRRHEAADATSVPAPPGPAAASAAASGFAWDRLEEQLSWYDAKSARHKAWFQRLKVLQLVAAAAIPVAAGGGADAAITGSLGASVVVLEGLQQLFQLQQNWLGYRATAESLKHEKFLYLSRAGHYATAPRPDALLAERVEGLVSQEHAAWSSAQVDAAATRSARA